MVEFTDRQLGLLRGKIKPADNKEWGWLQNHANDIIPEENSSVEKVIPPNIDQQPPPGFEKGELERADPIRVESWQKATSPGDFIEERMKEAIGHDEED